MLPGQHNDARMSLAIALTAAREGAKLANHVEVLTLIKEKGIVKGVIVKDVLTGEQWEIYAKVVINATGHLPPSLSLFLLYILHCVHIFVFLVNI